MEHARELLLHLFRDLVALFGKTGAETLICLSLVALVVIVGFVVLFFYLILQFGGATFGEVLRFALEAFKAFRYQPRQKTHQSIRLELYFDAVLIVIMILSLGGLLAHSLVPWVKEISEILLFAVFASALVIFSYLAGVSIKIAVRFPPDGP